MITTMIMTLIRLTTIDNNNNNNGIGDDNINDNNNDNDLNPLDNDKKNQ